MTPIEIATQGLNLLGDVLQVSCDHAPQNDLRAAFIYRHARNIHDLGDDVLTLSNAERSGARIVIRSMLESLFRLVAASEHPHFAAEKLIAEAEGDVEKMLRWRKEFKEPQNTSLDEAIDEMQRVAEKLRREHGVTSKNKWTVLDTARAAGLAEQYACDYFFFSRYAHSTVAGIISQEQNFESVHVMQAFIYIVLMAAARLSASIETSDSADSIKKAEKLIASACDYYEKRQK